MPRDNYLYRYRSMSSKGLKRIFTHCELYFASPKDVNDPFDCKPPIDCENYTEKDILEHHRLAKEKLSKKYNVNTNISEEEIDNIMKDKNNFIKKYVEPLYLVLRDESSKLGMLCLSEKCDDILMWSHYTDSHRGIVLEFDKSVFDSNFYCRKVDYNNNL